jgi:hypothetical protein
MISRLGEHEKNGLTDSLAEGHHGGLLICVGILQGKRPNILWWNGSLEAMVTAGGDLDVERGVLRKASLLNGTDKPGVATHLRVRRHDDVIIGND